MGRDILPHDATELSPNQLAAVAALGGGASVTIAAERAGIDRTTLHRWLAGDAAFVAALNRTKREAWDAIRGELRSAAGDAARAVRELVTSPNVPPVIRLRAALALLESVGYLVPDPIGPTDAGAVETSWRQAERIAELDRLISMG